MTACQPPLRPLCAGALLLVSLLPGCGSAPPAPSAAEREAVRANQRAERAFQQGRHAEARALYEQALRIDASVENAEGIAVNLLSLARVAQASGKPAEAHGLLERVLAEGPLALPEARKAEAAGRKAQLHLTAGELAPSVRWAETAESLCRRSDCASLAAILNLRARAALAGEDAGGALAFASRALEAGPGRFSDAHDARIERANALRLQGEARLRLNDAPGSLGPLQEALALDQSLRLPARIFSDLMLIGRALQSSGRRPEARVFYARALEVGVASEDVSLQKAARASLDGL